MVRSVHASKRRSSLHGSNLVQSPIACRNLVTKSENLLSGQGSRSPCQ